VEISKPTSLALSDKNAYVVAPTVFHFKQHGKPDEMHGTMTFTLQKADNDWRISAFTWSDR
jgi:hypothetical protein